MEKLSSADIEAKLVNLKKWSFDNGHISRLYKLNSFMESISLVNLVSDKAEKIDHHPNVKILRLLWSSVNFSLRKTKTILHKILKKSWLMYDPRTWYFVVNDSPDIIIFFVAIKNQGTRTWWQLLKPKGIYFVQYHCCWLRKAKLRLKIAEYIFTIICRTRIIAKF